MDVAAFVRRYPTLYHMAEAGSWPSIRERGLLSTTATLDLSGLLGRQRMAIEETRRPTKVSVALDRGDELMLRDQKPMSDARLIKCLRNGITPQEWYKFINGKTFFWATEARLNTLLAAYAEDEHDVLAIDAASLVAAHGPRMWLCHMNSGNTTPWAHPRDFDVFKRIGDYEASSRGTPRKEVAEVVVDYSVPDIASHVRGVRRMRDGAVVEANPY